MHFKHVCDTHFERLWVEASRCVLGPITVPRRENTRASCLSAVLLTDIGKDNNCLRCGAMFFYGCSLQIQVNIN